MIIGSVVGVNMICQIKDVSIEKCKSRILFVIERLSFSIFNTLVIGMALLGFLYYRQLNIELESEYFMGFLVVVLITSAMSGEITSLIVSKSKIWLEKKATRLSGGKKVKNPKKGNKE
jgi:hypothetical protein